ncbi:NADH:flavin oxidoreductase/NADH oxidase [Mrakia frigida]|uniref:NADH:flavin oxidoreductase/NADH oxidase n=1 Tax=Mrakia frigida TaxID=29902 RepID=UPI003FCC2135
MTIDPTISSSPASSTVGTKILSPAVPDAPYFIPLNTPAVGTELVDRTRAVGGPETKLFSPLTIRGVEFKNRLFVSPMCQYSSDNGHATDWHLVHIGSLAVRGAGAICMEATAVLSEGRSTPEDAGLWQDSQIEPLRRIVNFSHTQGTLIGIQLQHAGRKSSGVSMFAQNTGIGSGSQVAHVGIQGGWDEIYGASPIAQTEATATPKEASEEYLARVVQAFVDATRRAKEAGFDFIEIHGAHGYLLHSFNSPLSNIRTDRYGGSFENRIRLSLEIAKAVRTNWDGPLFYRVSGTDWAEGPERDERTGEWKQWGIQQTVALAGELAKIGVDLIDVSSGGLWADQRIRVGPGYQVPLAEAVKKAHPNLLVGTVGLLTTGRQAEGVLREGRADVIFAAREFLRDSSFVLRSAEELGVVVKSPAQYERAWTRMAHGHRAPKCPALEEKVVLCERDNLVGNR